MKIVMIGPEGSGKTVFLAMLSRYIATHAPDMILTPSDLASSDYIAAAQAALDRGDWPRSNVIGNQRDLKFQFGTKETLYDLVIIESSRHGLLGILKGIGEGMTKQQLKSANVLMFFLDLEGLLKKRGNQSDSENAFLLKEFLTNRAWRGKERMVIVSKAALYHQILGDDDVRLSLKREMADFPFVIQAINANEKVPFLAISSIQTTTETRENGNSLRIPSAPILCGDFEAVVKELRRILGKGQKPTVGQIMAQLIRDSKSVKIAILIIVFAVIFVFSYFPRQKFRITFYTNRVKDDAGTDAQIYVVLIGDDGARRRLDFDGRAARFFSSRDPFERGGVDPFTRTTKPIGAVHSLEVGTDNSGNKPGWLLDRIEIEELHGDSVVSVTGFTCGKWLNESNPERTLPADK